MSDWPFASLRPLSYGVIHVDPPWAYEMRSDAGYAKSPQAHYDCMDQTALKALPVGHLAAGDAVLWLWAVWPLLPQALELMAAWGFTFKTGGAWAKKTPSGKTTMGTGYILRSACEPFLIGTMGEPKLAWRGARNLVEAVRREHSRKPDEVPAMLERMYPTVWRCELFARTRRPGWDCWGNQVDQFEGMTDGQ